MAEPTNPNQIPGSPELWKVDNGMYLVYRLDGLRSPMVWMVEHTDQLKAWYGDNVPAPAKTMTQAEFQQQTPWLGGLASELQNTEDDPWAQFGADYRAARELRPWLADPTMLAVMAVAYLEGRDPTADELAQTEWWNSHTAEERSWLEFTVTAGDEEVNRREEDAIRQVETALREAGAANVNRQIVSFVAMKRLTGAWSEGYTAEQVRLIADPYAPGRLDAGLSAMVKKGVTDRTRAEEDTVRDLAIQWLGPDAGRMDQRNIAQWAGRVRNNPDGLMEFTDMLRQQRMALFPGYENPNLTYEDIVTPYRNLASNIWGQSIHDETMLVGLANLGDFTEASKRLRRSGLSRGIQKVVSDSLDELGQTPIGDRVVQSSI